MSDHDYTREKELEKAITTMKAGKLMQALRSVGIDYSVQKDLWEVAGEHECRTLQDALACWKSLD